MSEALLKKFIYNGETLSTEKFDTIYEDRFPSIYEVIRIMNGVPLFLEEHYERFVNSAKILGFKLNISIEEIKDNISKMININEIDNYNIKIVINNLSGKNSSQYYFFISSNYPGEDMYKNGIKTITYRAVRENPNAKVINKNLRDEINRLLKEKDCYEALLVNEQGDITEGSRSNTFFIMDGKVYTSPSEGVLLGITRQRIISLCMKNNIEVIEKPVSVSDLPSCDALFMSGTSPKVLPISKVDDADFSTHNELLLRIMKIYDDEIKAYIESHK